MSTRGYKVIRIETKETPSFDLWYDEEFTSFLNRYDISFDNALVDIPVEVIKEFIKQTDNRELAAKLKEDIVEFGIDDVITYLLY